MFSADGSKQKLLLSIFIGFLFLNLVGFTRFDYFRRSELQDIQEGGFSLHTSAIMEEIFVSPDGLDSNSGTDVLDPFQTIDRAMQEVATLTDSMTGDIVVYLKDGVYRINETIFLNASHSGKNGYNVIIQNYNGAIPTISGGKQVDSWTEYGGGIWNASVEVDDFRQLYVNGQKAVRARGSPDFIIDTDGDGHTAKDERMITWRNIQDVEFVYENIWTLSRVQVDWVRKEQIYMQQPAYLYSRTNSDSQKEAPIWIENAMELLDEPGEWYFDKPRKQLYYMPRVGEQMASSEAIAPNVEVLLNVTGNASHPLHNIQFRGIQFKHANWLRPNLYGACCVTSQANVLKRREGTWQTWEMSDANIYVGYASDIMFYRCNFTQLGSAALDLREGVQNSSVIGCKIYDNAGSGIQVGETDHFLLENASDPRCVKNIIIENNYITNCCTEYKAGVGVFGLYLRNVTINHNTISNLPYTGISLGWGWSPDETVAAENDVVYNDIYGIMNFLRDGGGIYTLSTQPGTNVSYNVIHDSGWNGLYPDERTNGTMWSFNIVYDTDNNFLDHSLYEEAHWNVVTNNYIEEYPANREWWYSIRDNDQIWGLRPGLDGYPSAIEDKAGVEPAFDYLIPNNEHYWQYEKKGQANPIAANPAVFWVSLAAICSVAAFGGYAFLFEKGGLRDE